jgi:hypothetical protein
MRAERGGVRADQRLAKVPLRANLVGSWDEKLATVKRALAAQAEERTRQIGEFAVWRPTPTREENNLMAAGELTMVKLWDLSPIDQSSFDPFEPPGRPGPPVAPPVNNAPPVITVLDTLELGEQLIGQVGVWSGSPTYARQWKRGALDIAGETGAAHTLVGADVGSMIGFTVTGTNAGGSMSADATEVGPVVQAPPPRRR